MTDIQLTAVSKSYGRCRVLDRITLDVGTGVLGLLGPNGAGKTTLLRVLATVAAADAGRVELLGRDARDPLARVGIRRRLGYVPQETGVPRGFTAFKYVDYVGILKELTDRRARHDEVRRVLEAVGLTTVARRRVWRLSGGTNQQGLVLPIDGSYNLIVARHSNKCLDKAGNGDVVQWACHAGRWQQWKRSETGIPTA